MMLVVYTAHRAEGPEPNSELPKVLEKTGAIVVIHMARAPLPGLDGIANIQLPRVPEGRSTCGVFWPEL